ncbi:MAG TPA: TonB-dependent receptor [Flavobacteriia bacterium]|nr:TonB-dependent receptor [Flavobacteriia bacterium]
MQYKILLFLSLLFSQIILANGNIRGVVIDAETGEPIMSANVTVEGTTIGTTTDFDGNYNLNLKEGIYTLKFSSLGYTTQKISGVNVINNKVTEINVSLKTSNEQLETVIISANNNKRTASALLTMQKKSVKLLDGISLESIKKSGDSNAADAIKRVTGVSIEGGKYIFVRGLTDRYTKTTLNGVAIPGLDPDRNTVQMDLFPTNLIDNIVVYKTFMPDLPGDFTGGLIDLTTKDFPTKKTFELGLGFSATSGMNFNKDFILYDTKPMDILGLGYNARKLNFPENTIIPDESYNDPTLTDLTKSFSKELGVKHHAPSFLNQNFNISFGNQYIKSTYKLGFNVAFNYSNSYNFYDDMIQGVYFKDTDHSVYQLDKMEETRGSVGSQNVIWSGLIGTAFKFDKSKYVISFFHSQNGKGEAADYISQNFDQTNATLYKDAIQYSQKSLSNLLLSGTHHIKDDKLKIEWKIAPSYSNILDPDVRSTRLSYDDDTQSFQLQLGDGAGIDRYYRTLKQQNLNGKADFTYKLKIGNDEDAKIKAGIANEFRIRDYNILDFSFNKTSDFNDFTEDPNTILTDDHIWNATSQSGIYVRGNQNLDNKYQAIANTAGVYAMNEVKLTSKLKTIYGLRVENAIINYDGYVSNQPINQKVHDETAFLPSVNFIYNITDNTNLRMSYSNTVARPSFKEKSNAHIYDPISQNLFIGNLNLKETKITNFDLRWENFFNKGEMYSVSAFLKDFKNPIEIVPFQLSPNNIQPKNSKNAVIYGLELELKKNLTKEDAKYRLAFGSNFSYIISKVNTKEVIVNTNGKTEYQLRLENARDGEKIDPYRTMQGQAPFIINSFLNVQSEKINVNLSYNVQGKKLVIVGSGIVPDIYEKPFNSLNMKTSYIFGQNKKYKINFSVRNILNSKFNQVFESYKAANQVYRSYSRDINFGLSFSYKIY